MISTFTAGEPRIPRSATPRRAKPGGFLKARRSAASAERRTRAHARPAFFLLSPARIGFRAVRFQATNYTTANIAADARLDFRYDSRSRPISFLAAQKHARDESVILTKARIFVRITSTGIPGDR